jgi:hypothetical protein
VQHERTILYTAEVKDGAAWQQGASADNLDDELEAAWRINRHYQEDVEIREGRTGPVIATIMVRFAD